MVGMKVRIDDVENAHARRLGDGQIRFDLADGIDHGAAGLAAAAEQVGDRYRVAVQE